MEDGKQLSGLTVRVIAMRNGDAEWRYGIAICCYFSSARISPFFSLSFFPLAAEIFETRGSAFSKLHCYSDIMAL